MHARMIPNLFSKMLLPHNIPPTMKVVVRSLQRCKSKKECLAKAYAIITEKNHGSSYKTYLLLHRVFQTNIDELWKQRGFMHCTTMNYLLRVLLVKSGHFNDDDITLGRTHVWGSIHQYLIVRIGKTFINIDPWSRTYGVVFGQYLHGFPLGIIFQNFQTRQDRVVSHRAHQQRAHRQ